MSSELDKISFVMPKEKSNSIKVIGVGGGGSNAVNHMFTQNIKGVDFVICNTDEQALKNSPIPNKIQLGASLTSGLGAGANPEIGSQSAKESMQEIQQMLTKQTKMVFITAGMGGGTGTGAAPIIAKIAKDMDILTVGIVTKPFQFEGKMRLKQAELGINQLRSNVDSLIVIDNNKLREVYGNLGFKAGFSKADEVLSTASRGIAEVITHHYKQNIDLHDAKTVLSNSGTAIMGSAKEEGKNRAKDAIVKALDSPLLNDNKITGAKNVLLLIVSGTSEVTIDEIGEINDHIQDEAGYDANIIMGVGEDKELGDAISVTVVATGFAVDQQRAITETEVKKIVHTLEDDQKITYDFSEKKVIKSSNIDFEEPTSTDKKIIHILEEDDDEDLKPKLNLTKTTSEIKNTSVAFEETLSEEDLVVKNVTPTEIEKPNEDNSNLLFDLPLNSKASEDIVSKETEEESVKEITARNDKEKTTDKKIEIDNDKEELKYHILNDFSSQPTIKQSSTISINNSEEDNTKLKLKTKPQPEINTNSGEDSPLGLSISELSKREERNENFKKQNYTFSHRINKSIDEIERQPAYKRKGLDVDANASKKKDNDDKTNFDSKSSFLQDDRLI